MKTYYVEFGSDDDSCMETIHKFHNEREAREFYDALIIRRGYYKKLYYHENRHEHGLAFDCFTD